MLFPGYVTHHKNHATVIQALTMLPKVTAVFVGQEDYSLKARLMHLAQTQGVEDRVEWNGFVSTERLEEEYDKAALLVMPSRWEAASGPILEAVVRELPFVASDVAPIRAQLSTLGIDPPTFKWDDPSHLAAAVEKVLGNYEYYLAQTRRVAPTVRSRTWVGTARDYQDVFSWVGGSNAFPAHLTPGETA
jgi:glycosyltransferase involved in cell wall biosynthesis